LGARLVVVIDTLDAITSDRPYRTADSFEHAYEEIVKMGGIQFDPLAVQAFVAEEAALREMVKAKCMQSHDPAITLNTNGRSWI
jgi:HD-GYP domain-containing protein (c-di-GMP phosphodiesterase class II)